MDKNSKIYLAGHRGLVGSAILRLLLKRGFNNVIYRTIDELDLTNQIQVNDFMAEQTPEYVIIAAAKVGGILANSTYPADFIYQNLMIETNLIHAAYQNKVKKLLFLGSSCIYPRLSPQPIKEEYLLTGPLEQTNEVYAIAKIAGLKMVEYYRRQYGCDFISAMPTNLYGINDNFHPSNSHVLPAMLRKLYLAKCMSEHDQSALKNNLGHDHVIGDNDNLIKILKDFGLVEEDGNVTLTLWGTGNVYREFLYVDDLADALIFLIDNYSEDMTINVGTGNDVTIMQLAELINSVVGFKGNILWDSTKPDGMPKKQLDVSRLRALGWESRTQLLEGIQKTYEWYLRQ